MLEPQTPGDQISEQVGDDDGVLGVAEHQPDRHLRPIGGDHEGDDDHLIGDVEPVDHQHRRLNPGQIAGQQLGHRLAGRGDEPARHRRLRHRRPTHRTDRFGDFDVTAGRDTGEHPLDHHLTQQVLRRERLPRGQLDLAAIDVTATRSFHADLAGAQHDLTGGRAMPVPDPLGELGVLLADDRGQLGGEHLLHHHQPRRGRERQQPFAHRRGDISHRHRRFQRQASQLGGRIRCRDLHDRYLLHR